VCLSPYKWRRFAKRKSKDLTLLQYNFPLPFSRTKSMQSMGWNPQLVAEWNLAKGEHGINAEHCMESRTKGNGEIQAIA
jgi:hypothetical protein